MNLKGRRTYQLGLYALVASSPRHERERDLVRENEAVMCVVRKGGREGERTLGFVS